MVAHYIATRPLLELCKGAKQRESAQVTLSWRDQSGIDWEKANAKETETESASDSDSGSDKEGEELWETESRASGSVGQNGAGRVRMNGHEGNLDNILNRPESSD